MAHHRGPNGEGRRTGLLFLGAPHAAEMVRLACRAEELGFESVWVAETRLTRDALVPLAAIAQATSRIKVGTGIVNVFSRGPVLLAVSFTGLCELAPDRVIMGIGAGAEIVLGVQGIPFDRPLTRLREYLEVIPPLVRGEQVDYQGQSVTVPGAKLEDAISGTGGAAAAANLPIYVGATGPRALQLTGEVADGVLLNGFLPPAYVERAVERVAEGARRAGRDPADVDVAMGVVVSPDADSRTGKDRARRAVALYLALFPAILAEARLDEEVVAHALAEFQSGGLEAAAAAIPDEVVDAVCAAGTPQECRAKIDVYRAAGVRIPVLTPLDGSAELAIETLI